MINSNFMRKLLCLEVSNVTEYFGEALSANDYIDKRMLPLFRYGKKLSDW